MIEIRGVSKSFGDVPAVRNVSLQAVRGELIAVLGPSGCGKTTLLRLVGGYEAPDQGSILLDGKDVTGLPPDRRPVGMVFQNYALFPHLTALGNVEFGLRMRGVASVERRRRALEMLRLVGLDDVDHRRPAELSGGQQQRVALARAVVLEPEVLLLDEPLANLDRNVRLRMRDELKAIQRRLRITTVLVTHDQEEALALADRIALMDTGRIEQCGRALDLCLHPASPFVSEFFGLSP